MVTCLTKKRSVFWPNLTGKVNGDVTKLYAFFRKTGIQFSQNNFIIIWKFSMPGWQLNILISHFTTDVISLQRINPLYLEPEIAELSSKLIPSKLFVQYLTIKHSAFPHPKLYTKLSSLTIKKKISHLVSEISHFPGSAPEPYYLCLV